MVCAKTTVLHESGLHMRPAQEFVSAVANYPCKVTIKVGDKSVNGKSILSVMAAGIKRDTPILMSRQPPGSPHPAMVRRSSRLWWRP